MSDQQQARRKSRRDSDSRAAELVKMEKVLQESRSAFETKMEGSEDLQENMVEDLEERVRFSRRHRRNSLHHTQMMESQMKTMKGELVGTLDHLQELRDKLRRSQEKAEERKATIEKLTAGFR